MTMFLITSDTPSVRIKGYDANTKGKTTTLRVTIEVTDAYELAHRLETLERLMVEQANKERLAKVAAKTPATPGKLKRIDQQRMLALPPPSREDEAS